MKRAEITGELTKWERDDDGNLRLTFQEGHDVTVTATFTKDKSIPEAWKKLRKITGAE